MFRRRARAQVAREEAVDAGAAPPGERTAAYERRPVGRRRRVGRGAAAGAAVVGTAGAGILALARLIMTIATLIALVIVAAILLRDLDANATNSLVKAVHNVANFFAGSFTGLFKETGHAKREITINWGIAAVVYLLVGVVISRLIGSVGRGGLRFGERRRAAAL
jgi:hypothetical protein